MSSVRGEPDLLSFERQGLAVRGEEQEGCHSEDPGQFCCMYSLRSCEIYQISKHLRALQTQIPPRILCSRHCISPLTPLLRLRRRRRSLLEEPFTALGG
jgi:hypothetical protein